MSRFDLILVLKDECDENADRDLANFVVNSHYKCHELNNNENSIVEEKESFLDDVEIIPVDDLRK